jgi:hypothetical protein
MDMFSGLIPEDMDMLSGLIPEEMPGRIPAPRFR